MALGVASVALLVIRLDSGPEVTGSLTPGLEGEPDVYMESPVVSQYRDDGTLEYRLTATRASHFEQLALTRLAGPQLMLFRDGEAHPWQVSAREGTLRRPPDGAAEEVVALSTDVTLEQTQPDGEHVRLTTGYLDLYPRRQYARTDQNVMIESTYGRTTATGLQGDLKLGKLTLLSIQNGRVRTVLQPDQFK